MHAKRIRNLLTAVLMTGAVLGNAGIVPAEEMPDDALSVSAPSGAEEELPDQEQEEPVPEEMAVLPSDADAGEEEIPSEMEVPSSGSEAQETESMSSSSGMEESPPGTGDGTDPADTCRIRPRCRKIRKHGKNRSLIWREIPDHRWKYRLLFRVKCSKSRNRYQKRFGR